MSMLAYVIVLAILAIASSRWLRQWRLGAEIASLRVRIAAKRGHAHALRWAARQPPVVCTLIGYVLSGDVRRGVHGDISLRIAVAVASFGRRA